MRQFATSMEQNRKTLMQDRIPARGNVEEDEEHEEHEEHEGDEEDEDEG
jgi:hypothetical protein